MSSEPLSLATCEDGSKALRNKLKSVKALIDHMLNSMTVHHICTSCSANESLPALMMYIGHHGHSALAI